MQPKSQGKGRFEDKKGILLPAIKALNLALGAMYATISKQQDIQKNLSNLKIVVRDK